MFKINKKVFIFCLSFMTFRLCSSEIEHLVSEWVQEKNFSDFSQISQNWHVREGFSRGMYCSAVFCGALSLFQNNNTEVESTPFLFITGGLGLTVLSAKQWHTTKQKLIMPALESFKGEKQLSEDAISLFHKNNNSCFGNGFGAGSLLILAGYGGYNFFNK